MNAGLWQNLIPNSRDLEDRAVTIDSDNRCCACRPHLCQHGRACPDREWTMFLDETASIGRNEPRLGYGVAVTDVDGDGAFEFVVAGYGCANLVLKWDGHRLVDIADAVMADARRNAIGLCAADADGDGREELYILNSESFTGPKQFGDRLFACFGHRWLDLFSQPENFAAINQTAGRSVACIDRAGTGKYGFVVANHGGRFRLYEFDRRGRGGRQAGGGGGGFGASGGGLGSAAPVSGP